MVARCMHAWLVTRNEDESHTATPYSASAILKALIKSNNGERKKAENFWWEAWKTNHYYTIVTGDKI